MTTIEEKWASYVDAVLLPLQPSAVQARETRRAFYAGAAAMFDLMTAIEDSEGKAIQQLARFQQEIRAFAEELTRGQA